MLLQIKTVDNVNFTDIHSALTENVGMLIILQMMIHSKITKYIPKLTEF